MKFRLIIVFFIFTVITSFAFNQEERENETNLNQKIGVSMNYIFSALSYSQKGYKNYSILTWRDIHMNGVQANIDIHYAPFGFERSNIGISYSSSFHGYWTDDDANNYVNQIAALSVKASSLCFSIKIKKENNFFNPILGFDFNCLWFDNYDPKYFNNEGISIYQGLITTYDIYRFSIFGGYQIKLLEGRFGHIRITELIGFTSYLNFADWIYNVNWKHPVSFLDFGVAFRISAELDAALSLSIVTLFIKAQLLYETTPFGFSIHPLPDGTTPTQFKSYDFSQSSLSLGFMVNF